VPRAQRRLQLHAHVAAARAAQRTPHRTDPHGQGDLETPIRLRDRTELGALAHTVNDMARDLKRAQVAMLAQGRLEHEVDIARQIQRSLLPSEARRIGNAFVCGDQKSATEVGGDYYDILTLPDGRVAIAIADVAGKGSADASSWRCCRRSCVRCGPPRRRPPSCSRASTRSSPSRCSRACS
jgi:HAMP domain-containing protein